MTNQSQPLPVLFVQTSMPVGGAETLLVNLVQKLDPTRFTAEVVCLKEPGPLGKRLIVDGCTVHHGLLTGKYDLRVLPRLIKLMRQRKYAAVITVGAGDKMFWGRLAARIAGVPVLAAALHSTGWPDGVGRLNRLLTPITDAFIAVAKPHGEFLVKFEKFPESCVRVIPNGVDTERFTPANQNNMFREELDVHPTTPLVGILAALRPEKNHELFLRSAKRISEQVPEARFVIIGDGPCRDDLEQLAQELELLEDNPKVHFLGNRDDVPAVLAAIDVLALTSHNEANPVSILEAMSCGKPVVTTDVGSVRESVREGETGHVIPEGDEEALVERITGLLLEPVRAQAWGDAGRKRVQEMSSLEVMVGGYERLITEIYEQKTGHRVPETGVKQEQVPTAV